LSDTDQAISLNGNEPANYLHRAAVLRALDRNDDAIADLRKALSLNPNATRKRQIEDALRDLDATP